MSRWSAFEQRKQSKILANKHQRDTSLSDTQILHSQAQNRQSFAEDTCVLRKIHKFSN